MSPLLVRAPSHDSSRQIANSVLLVEIFLPIYNIKDHCEHAKVATASGARDFDTHFVEQSGTNGC